MKIKLECKDITYDLIEELKQKIDIEPNDIGSWKSLVDLLEIKIGGLEGQIKVLEERQEMLVETNNGLGEEIDDLEKENQKLKKPKFDLSALNEAKKIEINYDEKLLKQIETLKQENQELKDEKRYYKDKYLDLYNSYQNCEDLKRKRAIELLKDMFNINLWVDDMDCYIRIGKCDYLISWEQYKILSEVLE